jgi:hypothetical protein
MAETVIQEKYLSGLDHFAKVISLMNSSQPFLSGNMSFSFEAKNEKDYVLKLFELVNRKLSNQEFSKDIKEFMDLAKGQKKKNTNSEKDILAQLSGMEKNHVTLFAFEYPDKKGTPCLMTYRGKTLRSVRDKIAPAFSALLAFYGEQNLAQRVYLQLPSLLESAIIDAKKNELSPKALLKARDNLIREIHQEETKRITSISKKEAYSIWQHLSDKRKSRIWEEMPQNIRSSIVASLGNYGSLIKKYNTWKDIQNIFGDLFAMTLAYPEEYDQQRIEKQIVRPLLLEKGYSLHIVKDSIEYITRRNYQASHIDIYADGFEDVSSNELHLTSIEKLLANDTIGEGCHNLLHLRRTRELKKNIEKSEKMIDRLDAYFGEKKIVEGISKTEGLLSCIKKDFGYLYKALEKYGVITSVSPSERV